MTSVQRVMMDVAAELQKSGSATADGIRRLPRAICVIVSFWRMRSPKIDIGRNAHWRLQWNATEYSCCGLIPWVGGAAVQTYWVSAAASGKTWMSP